MATFPGGIDYTKASPSGKIPAVDMRMPATGGLEAIGRGLENLGQDFDRVDNAKAAIEFSTKKRQFEEMSNAALNAHKVSGDPVEKQKLKEQWAKDADAFTSDNPRVARELTKYKNSVMPDLGQTFANHDLTFQARQNKDAFQINLQHRMETGEIGEAAKDIHTYRVTTGQISEAEEAEMVKDLPNNSILARAEKAIGNKDGKTALDLLSQVKDMNPEQTTQYHKLNIWAKQVSKIGNDDSKDSILGLMLQNDNMEYGEKAKQAEKMQEIASKNLTGDERAKWQMIVIPNWLSGKNEVDNQEIVVQLAEDKRDAYLGNFKEGTTEPLRMSDVTDYVRKAAEDGKIKLSTRDKILKEDYKEFEKYQVHSLNEEMKWAKGDIVQKGKQPLTLADFEIATPDGEPITPTDSLSQEQSEKLQYVEEGLKKYIKNHKDVMDYEIRTERQKLVAMALSGYTQKPTGETFGPPAPSLEQIGKPKPEELRKQNTEEAYNKGVQLGYWQ